MLRKWPQDNACQRVRMPGWEYDMAIARAPDMKANEATGGNKATSALTIFSIIRIHRGMVCNEALIKNSGGRRSAQGTELVGMCRLNEPARKREG